MEGRLNTTARGTVSLHALGKGFPSSLQPIVGALLERLRCGSLVVNEYINILVLTGRALNSGDSPLSLRRLFFYSESGCCSSSSMTARHTPVLR